MYWESLTKSDGGKQNCGQRELRYPADILCREVEINYL